MTAPERFVRNSETGVWRRCRLKWYLSFYLGFLSARINSAFWLGTLVHHVLSEWYLGRTTDPAHMFWELGSTLIDYERMESITIEGVDLDFNNVAELEEVLAMGVVMIEGYVEWAERTDDFDVIDSELSYYMPMLDGLGREFTFVCKLDLLTESTEGIRVRDFKTAKDFRARETVHLDSQFRRYPLIVRLAHPDWAKDVVGSEWVGLRKIIPSNRSKPPYFDRVPIDLTAEEYASTEMELLVEVTDILSVEEELNHKGSNHRAHIYPNPTMNCSWDCDFFKNGMCVFWRSGGDVTEYGLHHGTFGNDAYAEYRDEDESSVLVTIGRREGDG